MGKNVNSRRSPAGKQAEQLTRLLLTCRDFQLALSAVTFLLEEVDWEGRHTLVERRRFYCYESAFVVAYVRPFVQARGGVRPFSWKDIAMKLSDDEKTLHERLILDRNKLVAHSDADYVDVCRVIYRTYVDEDRDPFDFAFPRYREGATLTCEQCRTGELILKRALEGTLRAIQKLKDIADAGFDIVHV